jgi:thiol-disulfide isomerase/thioredoxin
MTMRVETIDEASGHSAPACPPVPPSAVTSLLPSAVFKGKLLGKTGPLDSTSLEGKVVCLYFSASWCAPCRQFTPLLSKKYTELKDAGEAIEIVYVPADRSEAEAMEYYKKMPWTMLKFDERVLADHLNSVYKVMGIPTLVILNEKGEVITVDGKNLILSTTFENIINIGVKKNTVIDDTKLVPVTLLSGFLGSGKVRTLL